MTLEEFDELDRTAVGDVPFAVEIEDGGGTVGDVLVPGLEVADADAVLFGHRVPHSHAGRRPMLCNTRTLF